MLVSFSQLPLASKRRRVLTPPDISIQTTEIAARQPGDHDLKVLEDAPGTYVMARS
jgi:hypothetical protein